MSPKSDVDIEHMSRVSYSSAIGSLMYVMVCTRPDLSYALSFFFWTNMHWVLLIDTWLILEKSIGKVLPILVYSLRNLEMDLSILILLVIWSFGQEKTTQRLCFHHWWLCCELEINFAAYCNLFHNWCRVYGCLWGMQRSYLVGRFVYWTLWRYVFPCHILRQSKCYMPCKE